MSSLSMSVRALAACCLLVLAGAPVHADPVAAPPAPIVRFHQVDSRLYRGAQPDAAGFRYLRDLGVRTIVNLREHDESGVIVERQLVESLGMRYVHLPVRNGNFFTRSRTIPERTIRDFFAIVDAAADGPVFVHCRRGADRTGALVGFYRVARQGWDGVRAYAEAKAIGMRSWYTGLKRQIETFRGETG